jgi:hypothetical protein
MPIRVTLTVAILTAGMASAASAATPGVMQVNAYGCPSAGVMIESNTAWKAKGYEVARKVAEPKGCLPFTMFERVTVIRGGDEAKCAVRQGETHECLWIPASAVKTN